MQASAEHVQYQLPNEHSRVGFLLEAIQCSEPGLQAAITSIKTDNGPEGMRNNFEATAAQLLPFDPVAKKRTGGYKRGSTQISSLMEASHATKKKPSIEQNLCSYPICKSEQPSQALQLFGFPIPLRSWGACFEKVCYSSRQEGFPSEMVQVHPPKS